MYLRTFETMPNNRVANFLVDQQVIASAFLLRDVIVDFYLPVNRIPATGISLLLINDGQDLVTMRFEDLLEDLHENNKIDNLLCIGIHCSADRKNEYGTASILDYKGRGAKAGLYKQFIFEELIPYIRTTLDIISFKEKAFAGFSLGGLSALDIVWNNPNQFNLVGVFSGSFWWREKSQDDEDFDENEHRIMHRQIKNTNATYPWLRFFFEVGTMDEVADRNNNGIIDAIDDTVSLIGELGKKGFDINAQVKYLELKDGRHDVPTWARAFPAFLQWGWGTK